MGCAAGKPVRICPVIDEAELRTAADTDGPESDAKGNPLLATKLQSPDTILSAKEQVELFVYCMSLGNTVVDRVKDRDVLAVFGNTGSGKSTSINFLYGCQLFSYAKIGSPYRSLEVLPKSKGGPYDSVTKIGHSTYSETLLPRFIQNSDSNLVFCDFPGFMDNRGWEINVSNSTTMAQILNNAGSLKFLICVNYNTLKANRAKGLVDMLQLLEEVFGSRSNLEEASSSIMLGITCAPKYSLNQVKDILKENFDGDRVVLGLLENTTLICPVLQKIEQTENTMYDPIGEFSRNSILKGVEILQPVNKANIMFRPTLSPEDVRSIMTLQQKLEKYIATSMEERNFLMAKDIMHLSSGNGLDVSDEQANPAVSMLHKCVCAEIKRHISTIKQSFYGFCLQGPDFNQTGAEKALEALKACEDLFQFGEDIKSLDAFLKEGLVTNELYIKTRKKEDELIIAQLKLQTIMEEDIQTEAHLDSFKLRANEMIDEIEKLISYVDDDTVKERHSHTLDLNCKTLKGKIEEFQAYLDSRKTNPGANLFSGAMMQFVSPKDQNEAPREIVTDKTTKSNDQKKSSTQKGNSSGQPSNPSSNDGPVPAADQGTLFSGWAIGDDKLLRQRIDNPKTFLSESDSLKLLKACIKYGKLKGNAAKGQNLIVFLGASGSGKSTMVNAVSGCKLEISKTSHQLQPVGSFLCCRRLAEEQVIYGTVQVVPSKKGGTKDCVVQIGHGVQSCTLFPQLVQNEEKKEVYCDCPGFLDSRGMEINLGNVVSIITACQQAASVKVVLLVNYCSLIAERGKGATDTLNQCIELFGGRENLLKNNGGAVLIAITHAPMEEDPEDTLQCICSIVSEAKQESPLTLLTQLKSRILVFKPAGKQANIEELNTKIKDLNLFQKCNYQLTLSADDEKTIFGLMNKLNEQCKKEIEEQNMKDAKESLDNFIQVAGLLDHEKVAQVIELLRSAASTYLRPIIEQMNSTYTEDFENANTMFETIKDLLKLTDKDQYNLQQGRHQKQQLERDCQRFYEKTMQTTNHVKSMLDADLDDQELEGLMLLYLHTNGEDWINSHNWIHTKEKSQWRGVTCNNQGQVTEINLSDNNLHGIIPDGIFDKFEYLEVLDLSKNELYGELTETIEQLKNAQIIRLNDNKDLTGSMPQMQGVEIYCSNTGIGSIGTVSLEFSTFAFWVVSKEKFMKLDQVLPHETAKTKPGLMFQLVVGNQQSNFLCWQKRGSDLGSLSEGQGEVKRDEIMFLSHRWLRGMHPDDEAGSKIQQIKKVLQQEQFKGIKFIWMDYFCIPQNKENSDRQQRAINSLPHYVKCCSMFVTLVGNTGESVLEIYEGRGWCRFERFAAFTPMYNCEGGQLLITDMYTHNKDEDLLQKFQMTSMKPEDLNPLEGNFFDPTDKYKVGPSLVPMCKAIIRNHPSSEMKVNAEHCLRSVEHSDGSNALEVAAKEGRMDVVRSLLAAGIDPNQTDENKNTFLHRAARDGNTELIRDLLIAGADPNVMNNDGATPVFMAAERTQVKCMEILVLEANAKMLNQGALPVDRARFDEILTNVLIESTNQDLSELIKKLVQDQGFDIDTTLKNSEQKSPIMVAANQDKEECLSALLLHRIPSQMKSDFKPEAFAESFLYLLTAFKEETKDDGIIPMSERFKSFVENVVVHRFGMLTKFLLKQALKNAKNSQKENISLDFLDDLSGMTSLEEDVKDALELPLLSKVFFKLFNTNEEGEITPAELVSFLNHVWSDQCFNDYLTSDQQEEGSEGYLRPIFKAMFDKFDADALGQFSFKYVGDILLEILDIVLSYRRPLAEKLAHYAFKSSMEKVATEFMKELDEDEDGKISAEEFLSFFESKSGTFAGLAEPLKTLLFFLPMSPDISAISFAGQGQFEIPGHASTPVSEVAQGLLDSHLPKLIGLFELFKEHPNYKEIPKKVAPTLMCEALEIKGIMDNAIDYTVDYLNNGEDLRELLEMLLSLFDPTHSGYLDVPSLNILFSSIGEETDTADALKKKSEIVFSLFDADGDSRVTKAELISLFQRILETYAEFIVRVIDLLRDILSKSLLPNVLSIVDEKFGVTFTVKDVMEKTKIDLIPKPQLTSNFEEFRRVCLFLLFAGESKSKR